MSWALKAVERAAFARALSMMAEIDADTMLRPGWKFVGLDRHQLMALRRFYEEHTDRPAHMIGKPITP